MPKNFWNDACQICNDFSIQTTYTELNTPQQNRAECHIRETKKHIHRTMKARNVPINAFGLNVPNGPAMFAIVLQAILSS